jgi:hypothetical protein
VGKSFPTRAFAVPAVLLAAIYFAVPINAADPNQPRITAIQREVNLVSSDHTTRPASVNESIVDGTAVATGADSRAEITLHNGAIVRLSSNALFDFKRKSLEIQQGAMLVQVPRGAKARAESSGVVAELSGATAVLENQRDLFKFLVIEGSSRLHRGHMGDSVLVAPGQMVFGSVKSALSDPVDFEIARFVKTCPLVQDFAPLPSDRSIVQASNDQLRLKSKKRLIDTNLVIFGGGSTVSIVDPLNSTARSTDAVSSKPAESEQVRQ